MELKEFKKLAHELVMDITSTIGTFSLELDVTDDDLAKTQKLVKKFDETLTESIDSRKPKFNIRDYIVREYSDETYIGEVNDIKENHAVCRTYETLSNQIDLDDIFNLDNIRHATPEEIAEYKAALNFHKHGSKPFKLNRYDMLLADDGYRFFVEDPDIWVKEDFVSGRYTLLKTVEELEAWLSDGNE